MTRHRFSQLLTIAAFCAASTSLLGTAHATGFYVKFDCHGTNGLPNWSHTPNTITVRALINGFYVLMGSFTVPIDKCDAEDEIKVSYPAFTIADVEKIEVSTNGTNVFWADEVQLHDNVATKFWTWGIDNNVGYCFSQQPGDGANSYCLGGIARFVADFVVPQ